MKSLKCSNSINFLITIFSGAEYIKTLFNLVDGVTIIYSPGYKYAGSTIFFNLLIDKKFSK